MRDFAKGPRRIAAAAGASVILFTVGCGGDEPPPQPPPASTVAVGAPAALTGEQLFERCVTCHQANGQGMPGVYPPLAGSQYATATDPAVPIRIVLHGMQGPVTVAGATYNGVMPPYGTGVEMSDDDVAAVLTYVRQAWGNAATAVSASDVARVRAAGAGRTTPVTAEELQPLM